MLRASGLWMAEVGRWLSKSATKAAARSGWLRWNRVIPRFCQWRIGAAAAFVADLDTVRGSGV